MKPAKIDLAIYQGATFSKVMRWSAGGSPVDLTGYTARMQVRGEIDDEEALVELTTENGGIGSGRTSRTWKGSILRYKRID